MSEYLLELRNISKIFVGVPALRDVQLALCPGEVHALLGENGGGKSTLVKTMTGVHQPDSGEIWLDGQAVRLGDPRQANALGISGIYQELSIFPDLDIAEYFRGPPAAAVGRAGGLARHGAGRQPPAERAGREPGCAHQGPQPEPGPTANGGGRAVLVPALAHPDHGRAHLVADPARGGGLVPDWRRLRESCTAILFISHRLDELFEIAERVTMLRDGAYVSTQPMTGVSQEDLIRMMVGRTVNDLFPKRAVAPGGVVLRVTDLSRAGATQEKIMLAATQTV